MLLDESHPEPEPEPSARSGPTRIEPADRPAESAESAPAADAPAETETADGAPDTASTGETAQSKASEATTGIVETDLPGVPADVLGEDEAPVPIAVTAVAPVNQPVPAVAIAAAPAGTGVVPAEGGDEIAALDTTAKPAVPHVDTKAPAPGATPADPAGAIPADGVVDAEAAATAPLVKATAGKSAEEKPQTQPTDLEPVTLAPEQQPIEVKKAEAPNLPQPVKPGAAAKPQVTADPLQQTDIMKMSGDDIEVKAHGDQTQTATLTAAHAQTAQAVTGSSSAVQAQQQTPLVPVAGLAIEIAAQARAGKNRFEIRLDPPELGRIDVRLDVDREGHVTSRLVVERAETLDLLRRDAHSLERALNQAGLKTSDNSLQFSLRDQGADQGQGGDETRGERVIVPDDENAVVAPLRNYGRLLGLGSGLDIRV